ncbi:MAG: hypothetical protein HYV53_04585 [Parcubacteria group bacterium]|nr:hypothetical protein [Parcubacteria group bacterium]
MRSEIMLCHSGLEPESRTMGIFTNVVFLDSCLRRNDERNLLLAMAVNNNDNNSMDEEIKKILEENLALTKEIYAMTKKIKGYITFQKVMSLVYVTLIVVPIILSIIYLPPLLKGLFDQYKDILGIQSGSDNSIKNLLNGVGGNLNLNNIDLNKLPRPAKPEFK